MTTSPRIWSNRRYVLWLISDTAKGLGTALFAFAIPLVALFVTDSPAQAGVIGGVGMAVRLVMTLYGGVLADRHSRIAMMLLGAGIATALSIGFAMLSLADALTFATLLVVEVLLAGRAGVFEPASESAIKEIVPDEMMGRAQAANQGRDAALQLAGGPLGGLLLAAGAWLVGAVMTLAYALAAVTAWMLRGRMPRESIADAVPGRGGDAGGPAATEASATAGHPASARRTSALREMREGFAWLFARPDLGGVLAIITIVNLGFNAGSTTVIYALQQNGHSELTIGLISAAIGAVMLVGALFAPRVVTRIGAGVLTITGLCVAAAGVLALSAVHEPWAIALVFGAAVFLLPALNAGMMGYFMVATPTHLLGRANSAAGVLGMGAMPLAPLIAGFGLSLAGRTATILFCGALCLVAVLLAAINRPLRLLPAEAGWAAHARQFEVAEAPAPLR
ncbi:MFS transporter [Microbacterium sp.]|uniref:MFS transporter n=1 Tax=Microbacterium sp. TaxID=51671 RepID=UPI0028120693|nr:MFS transporter [Microbacterium sp.]